MQTKEKNSKHSIRKRILNLRRKNMNKYKIQTIMYKIKETIKNNINKKLLDRYNRIKM